MMMWIVNQTVELFLRFSLFNAICLSYWCVAVQVMCNNLVWSLGGARCVFYFLPQNRKLCLTVSLLIEGRFKVTPGPDFYKTVSLLTVCSCHGSGHL